MVEGYHNHYYTESNRRLPVRSSFTAMYLHHPSNDDEYGFDPGLNLDLHFFRGEQVY